MTPLHKKRLAWVLFALLGVGAAIAITLSALNKNINFFFNPSQIYAGEAPDNRQIRVGGLVLKDSVIRSKTDLDVEFVLSDTIHTVKVLYTGILPDLFREGQGIIALGSLHDDGDFYASEVLAKHDEKYMPPEIAEALQQAAEKKANDT